MKRLPSRFAAEWKRISARERVMFALLFYERLTPVETARTLGCTVREVLRTVETRFARLGLTLARPTVTRTRRSSPPRRMAA